MDKKNILILCTGNSCRSQIAEGYMKFFAGSKAKIYSAGTRPQGVNPMAVEVMLEDGIDLRQHTSNNVDEYLALPFDYIITVCDNAKEDCPYFPGTARRLHNSFPDPAHAEGTQDEVLAQFRQVRGMIKEYCKNFVAENLG